ncbi:MAG TPA: hypothetical protein ENF30_00430 [Candidatus Desulfofervidus auxilii]|uniref:PocR domain-containing protein n=1 Tax=Desulfofervidus auxilii TaxID=1621989 RepID=A0A7V0I9U9_DESA2|nr:hypothetical protein [Candidatus Desulfofervidus auxilii]
MRLTDILAVEEWQRFAAEIFEKYGMNAAINDSEGNVIHPAPGWANEICPLIKGDPQRRVVCASAQQNMMKVAKDKNITIIEECDVGFTKFVVPIFYKNEFLGTAGGCGVVLKGSEIDTFYLAQLLNKTEEEVEKMLSSVKEISEEELKQAVEFVERRIKEIVEK